MKGKTAFISILLIILCAVTVTAQDLSISTDDLVIELRADGGVHLFIRKKPGISSVLLTETTRDPELRSENYAYRAAEWNEWNGDEIRVLNGVPIPRELGIYSLISSTPRAHQLLGEAFHIYIPWVIYYGFLDTRHGAVVLADGTYLNIRAFELPYGDYNGSFLDNPFLLRIVQREEDEAPIGNYMKETEESFRQIADDGEGDLVYSNTDDLIENIEKVLHKERGRSLDLVVCLDTTNSMRPYIDDIKRDLVPMLREITRDFLEFRIGLVLYRDYREEYLTRIIPFTSDFNVLQRSLNPVQARGGGDIPEAVYEALHDGATRFTWENENRLIILIGDAPPHPTPRGRISRETVNAAIAERGIKISAILLPE